MLQKQLIIFYLSLKKTDHSLKFKLNGKRLTQTDTVKPLRILLDYHLLWSKQINHVATKLNQAIGILSRLRSRASLKILKITYHSFFVPTYCIGLSYIEPVKYNQPKQKIETSKQSLEENFV